MISVWQMKVSREKLTDTFLTLKSATWDVCMAIDMRTRAWGLICSCIKNHISPSWLQTWEPDLVLAAVSANKGSDSLEQHYNSGFMTSANTYNRRLQCCFTQCCHSLRHSTTSTTCCSSSLSTVTHRVPHSASGGKHIITALSETYQHNK